MGKGYLWIVVALATICYGLFLDIGEASHEQEMDHGPENTLMKKELKITVVYDNTAYRENLEAAWGFSCIITGAEKTILFDAGGDGAILLRNMERMGVDPGRIDVIVLSHIHGDHIGGLRSILEKNPDVKVYLPASFPRDFKSNIKAHGAEVIDVHEPLEICEHIYSTGEMGVWIKEQSLVLQTEKGIVVITGCAHPGIVEIVKSAKDLIKDAVLLVTGGFHLGGEGKDAIVKIIKDFQKVGVRYVGPCHCTGQVATDMFKAAYGENFIKVQAGRVIALKDLK